LSGKALAESAATSTTIRATVDAAATIASAAATVITAAVSVGVTATRSTRIAARVVATRIRVAAFSFFATFIAIAEESQQATMWTACRATNVRSRRSL